MNDNEFVKEFETIKNETLDVANASLSTQKHMMDSLNVMIAKYGDTVQEYMHYVASDVIDSYAKLELQRKECIDKYINFYAILFQDGNECDISKPIKSLMEKQQEDIAKWQNEVAPLIELKKIDDETSDEKANEVLESFKNL